VKILQKILGTTFLTYPVQMKVNSSWYTACVGQNCSQWGGLYEYKMFNIMPSRT